MNFKLIAFTIIFSTSAFGQSYKTFFEDFENNQNDWYVGSNSNSSASVQNGFYFYEGKEKKRARASYKNQLVDRDADFTIESSITLVSGKKDMGYGLMIGFEDWDNYMLVNIAENGMFRIGQELNNKWYNIVGWTKVESGAIKSKGNANHLKLEQQGNRYKFFINGVMVHDGPKSDLKFIGQGHGFYLSDKQKIKADYLRIKYLERPINVIQNATTSDKIENMGQNINSKYTEKGPLISADGKSLYFTTQNNPNRYVGNMRKSDACVSRLDPRGNWTNAELLPAPINNSDHNFVVSMLPDENTALLGNSYYRDGSMKKGVSQTVKRNGVWQFPEPLRIRNFQNKNEFVNYCLTPDGGHLIMAVETDQSEGGLDLYISTKESSGTWSQPKSLSSVLNTFADDFSPFIAADGRTLFFASKGHPGYGSADIFMSKRLDETWMNWSQPVNLGNGINTEDWDAYFKVDAKGEWGYMVSSGKNSMGDLDIFRIKLAESTRPDALELVIGKVYDAKTMKELDAQVDYEDLHSGVKMGTAYSTAQDGFKIALPKGFKYGFQAQVAGYMPIANNLDLTDLNNYAEKRIDLFMVPVETGQDFTMNNIFFDGNTANLSQESFLELDRLVQMMISNPSINIEIHNNQISGGLDASQSHILQQRIQAIQNYISQKKVDASRIKMQFEEIKFKPSLDINSSGEIRIKLF